MGTNKQELNVKKPQIKTAQGSKARENRKWVPSMHGEVSFPLPPRRNQANVDGTADPADGISGRQRSREYATRRLQRKKETGDDRGKPGRCFYRSFSFRKGYRD